MSYLLISIFTLLTVNFTDKWKTKAGKAAKSGERVTQFVQDLGIKAISDEETGKFSGIGLSRIIPSHPDYEGIIYFSDFNLSDWSFNGGERIKLL